MGFSKSDIDTIKSKVTIEDYVKEVIVKEMSWYFNDYTVDFSLKPYIKCPLHGEDTPSFRYYAESNTFYCFGCGAGGDVINLHKLFSKSLSDRSVGTEEAITFLKNRFVSKINNKNTNNTTLKILPKNKIENSSKALLKFERFYRDLDNTLRVDKSLSDDIKNNIYSIIDDVVSLVELEKINVLDAIAYTKKKYEEILHDI